jgi:hypothetical protein
MSSRPASGPDFLIIGAPRSGTSSLYEMLAKHPGIFMAPIKEPHYFSSFDFPFPENEILHITKDKAAYEKLFDGAGSRLRGEASSYYLADPAAPAKIKAYNPTMKLIALLRDPIDRAYSHYLLYERRGEQKESFYDQVQRLIEGGGDPVYDIVGLGNYGDQLTRYHELFSRGQLLVVPFDDLVQKPVETLCAILTFLGVDADKAADLQLQEGQNQFQVPRNQFLAKLSHNPRFLTVSLKLVPRPLLRFFRDRLLLKKGDKSKTPLDPQSQALLRQYYAPQLSKVSHLEPDLAAGSLQKH